MTDYEALKRIWESESGNPQPHPCFCIGPQNGEPECPCRMRIRRNEKNADWLKGFEPGRKSTAKGEPK